MFESMGFIDGVGVGVAIVLAIAGTILLLYIALEEREKRLKREIREDIRDAKTDNRKWIRENFERR